LTLATPAIELLALLSPSHIEELRPALAKTLGNLLFPKDPDTDTVRRVTGYAMKTYWAHVCDFVDHEFPQHTRAKTDVLVFFDREGARV
jgi:hypothetical protein